jgi:hypothetical protein
MRYFVPLTDTNAGLHNLSLTNRKVVTVACTFLNAGLVFFRNIESTGQSFADDFHLFGMTWTDNRIFFTVDNVQIGNIWAPQNGFWYYGGFQNNPGGTNSWQNGSWMAPFDKEVSL